MKLTRRTSLLIVVFCAGSLAQQAAKPQRSPDVPYVPTPQPVVDAMLKLGEVKKGDVLYDLGSGDGRIVITPPDERDAKEV